jgi:hypothetical protein
MTDVITQPTCSVRWALAFSAGLAMLLPMPARCAERGVSSKDCSSCATAHHGTHLSEHATRACCGRQNAVDPQVRAYTSHSCGCIVQRLPATVPSAKKLSFSVEQLSAFPVVGDVVADRSSTSAAASIPALASLPPYVPHRILHCSWII